LCSNAPAMKCVPKRAPHHRFAETVPDLA
jgi:hypothetical protein